MHDPAQRMVRPSASDRPTSRRLGKLALALAALLSASSCYIRTQRFPGPLEPAVDPLPAGTLSMFEPGTEDITVIRHADPVLVRAAGSSAPYELRFHSKQARVRAGSWVQTGAGGRAEILLGSGARILLSGTGSVVFGSESRLEPAAVIRDVTRATIDFLEGEQVRLPGGAVLASTGGPFVVERLGPHLIRLRNRAGNDDGQVAYRDIQFVLRGGEVVDLAVPDGGTAPYERDPGFRTIVTDHRPALEVHGQVEVQPAEVGARLRALDADTEIVGHGQVLRLDSGDEVWFRALGPVEEARDSAARAGSTRSAGRARPRTRRRSRRWTAPPRKQARTTAPRRTKPPAAGTSPRRAETTDRRHLDRPQARSRHRRRRIPR